MLLLANALAFSKFRLLMSSMLFSRPAMIYDQIVALSGRSFDSLLLEESTIQPSRHAESRFEWHFESLRE